MATLSPNHPLSLALEARREHINARVSTALRGAPGLQAEVVHAFLAGTLAPLAASVHALAPERTPELVERLVEAALPLLARDLLGPRARNPAVGWGWELLARWPDLLLAEPVRLARAVSNALYNLGSQPGARPLEWIERMGAAEAGSVETWLELGKVAAWRAGLAHAREGALAAARGLSPAQAGAALGLPIQSNVERDALLDRLSSDRWADPTLPASAPRQPRIVAEIGGFRGLGGPFIRPPRVVLADGGLVAFDDESAWTVAADRFGASFRRTHLPEAPAVGPAAAGLLGKLASSLLGRKVPGTESEVSVSADGAVRWGGQTATLPALAGASSQACDGATLAVTHPSSHALFLVALVPAERA